MYMISILEKKTIHYILIKTHAHYFLFARQPVHLDGSYLRSLRLKFTLCVCANSKLATLYLYVLLRRDTQQIAVYFSVVFLY